MFAVALNLWLQSSGLFTQATLANTLFAVCTAVLFFGHRNQVRRTRAFIAGALDCIRQSGAFPSPIHDFVEL